MSHLAKLGDVCDFQGGSQPPKSTFVSQPQSGYVRFLQIRDFDSERYVTYIPESGKNRLCEGDDILLGRYGASVGKVLTGKAGAYNVALMKVAPNSELLNKRFFYHYLTSSLFQGPLSRLGGRAAQAGFNKKDLSGFDIPIFPLAEQKRIVAILDEAFGAIDRAKAIANSHLLNVNELVRSVYREAFTGKLTANEKKLPIELPKEVKSTARGRAASDRKIMGEYALSVGEVDSSAPTGWTWISLASVARLESGHTPSRRKPEYWGGDVPWIGIKDAREHNGRAISNTQQYTNELGLANSAARLLPAGTVCLSRTASVGYVVVMGKEMATSQDFVNWVCSDVLDPEFLKHLLIAEKPAYRKFSSGAVHQTIYFPEVKAFHVCIPHISEQRKIVSLVDAALVKTSRVRVLQEQKLAALDELKQSILQKAFTGRLTEKAPELEAVG